MEESGEDLSAGADCGGVHWMLLSIVVERGEMGVSEMADPEASSADVGLKLSRPW